MAEIPLASVAPRTWLQRLNIDLPLLAGLIALSGVAYVVLYSAGGQDLGLLIRQTARLALGYGIMLGIAQIPPRTLKAYSPIIFGLSLLLLVFVLIIGQIGKGAQRWLDLGLLRFQPSELMKLGAPMMVASFLADRALPPHFRQLAVAALLILIPAVLIAKQPDLGTAFLIVSSGAAVLFISGLPWRYILGVIAAGAALLPILWMLMHDYQRDRVYTFLNPEADPLGRGYHIIQSKIAIGSGGIYGKGWLQGTQSHLEFLPEPSTDFIFAVFAEEFGLIGCLVLLGLYLFITGRCLFIVVQAGDTFGRLLSGGLSVTFFVYVFINIGMVVGILPVVGVPLPLISYGGTSMVTLMAGFGILMSVHAHRPRQSG